MGRKLRVLVACEESQTVTTEFRLLGHEAFSCDIRDCSGGHPEWHFRQDVTPLLAEKWDLIIAHPPCTFLSNAGARWLFAGKKLNRERFEKGMLGKEFFMMFYNAKCEKVAIENPIPSKIFGLPEPTQIIQPYEYGHAYSKKTCLWLKGLPILQPTNILDRYVPFVTSGTYSRTHDAKYSGASRKGGASIMRSKTFTGVARAMAEQWGGMVV